MRFLHFVWNKHGNLLRMAVIASEAWQSHKSNNKKEDRIIFLRKNGMDFFHTRLPRFARNDSKKDFLILEEVIKKLKVRFYSGMLLAMTLLYSISLIKMLPYY